MSWQRVMTRYNAGRTGGDESWSLDLARRAHFLEGAALLYDAAEDLESASERQDLGRAADALLNLAGMKWAGVTDELRLRLARLLVRHYGPRLLDGILLARRRIGSQATHLLIAAEDLAELRAEIARAERAQPEGGVLFGLRPLLRARALGSPEVATLRTPFVDLVEGLEESPARVLVLSRGGGDELEWGIVWRQVSGRLLGYHLGEPRAWSISDWSSSATPENPVSWSLSSRHTFETIPAEVLELAVAAWPTRPRGDEVAADLAYDADREGRR